MAGAIMRPILMLGGIAVVIVGVGFYWLTGGRVVSIDDAYVRAAKETIATDVSGIVQSVPVHEGQRVKRAMCCCVWTRARLKSRWPARPPIATAWSRP
jgi:membrane fusion protein (multidrug efflux system)